MAGHGWPTKKIVDSRAETGRVGMRRDLGDLGAEQGGPKTIEDSCHGVGRGGSYGAVVCQARATRPRQLPSVFELVVCGPGPASFTCDSTSVVGNNSTFECLRSWTPTLLCCGGITSMGRFMRFTHFDSCWFALEASLL